MGEVQTGILDITTKVEGGVHFLAAFIQDAKLRRAVKVRAIGILGAMHSESVASLYGHVIAEGLKNPFAEWRIVAAQALVDLNSANRFLTDLACLLADKDRNVRNTAVMLIQSL